MVAYPSGQRGLFAKQLDGDNIAVRRFKSCCYRQAKRRCSAGLLTLRLPALLLWMNNSSGLGHGFEHRWTRDERVMDRHHIHPPYRRIAQAALGIVSKTIRTFTGVRIGTVFFCHVFSRLAEWTIARNWKFRRGSKTILLGFKSQTCCQVYGRMSELADEHGSNPCAV